MTTEKLTTTIYDLTTGEVVTRDLNSAEIAQYEKDQQEHKLKKVAETEKEAERTAILATLGITADEAALLLG
jgi:hypothetical protein